MINDRGTADSKSTCGLFRCQALLRCLVEFTSDATERRRLQELCSRQGAADHGTYVRQAGLSLLDVLNGFPSCSPPIACVLGETPVVTSPSSLHPHRRAVRFLRNISHTRLTIDKNVLRVLLN